MVASCSCRLPQGSGVLLNFGTLLIHYNEGGGGGGGLVCRDGGGEVRMTGEEEKEEGCLTP